MNKRVSKRTRQWIALVGFFVICGIVGLFVGDWWAYRSGIVGVWGVTRPLVCFYPDHTFANIDVTTGTATLAGHWYELKKRDQFILVFRGGFHTTAHLRRRPFRLTYSEGDMYYYSLRKLSLPNLHKIKPNPSVERIGFADRSSLDLGKLR